jgi:hypothetical protein
MAAERPAKLPPTMIASCRMCLFLNGLAALSESAIEIRGQGSEGYGAQMRLEYGLDFAEGAVERTIYRLLYETAPLMLAEGYVVATRTPEKIDGLRAAGVIPVLCDLFDQKSLNEAVTDFRPYVIAHPVTDLPDQIGKLAEFLASIA